MIACSSLAIIPLAILTVVMWNASARLAEQRATDLQQTAVTIGDKINRNLFERYGDVQAFGLNTVVTDADNWYAKSEANPIVQVMNSYVDTYDLYYLTMLVDLDGKLIAVNSRDDVGDRIVSETMYDKSFGDATWFKDALSGRFTASEDGTFTGTVVEDLHVSPLAADIYGDEGLALGFTAPVKDADGKVIAIWKNIAKFSAVEEIVLSSYVNMASRGMASTEITLLDRKGNILIDCDPVTQGQVSTDSSRSEFEAVVAQRDMDIIGKLNLAERGVTAAQQVISGQSGGTVSTLHARKQIQQCAGYAPLTAVLGFPGMDWNVMVRVPCSEALALPNQLKMTCGLMFLFGSIAVLFVTFYLSNRLSKEIGQTVTSMQGATKGDFGIRVQSKITSDLGRMTAALDNMLDSLADAEAQAKKDAIQAADYEAQIAAVQSSQAVIEFGLDGIIYKANQNFLRTFGYTESEICGKHHQTLVKREYATSPEYAQFWKDLNSGITQTSEFCRIDKDGNEIWLQASYFLVKDEDGKPSRVVKFATDITESVLATRQREARDEKVAAYEAAEVTKVSSVLNSIATGDLTRFYEVASGDADTSAVHQAFTNIADSMNAMCKTLQGMIGSVVENAGRLNSSSTRLSSTANDLSRGAEHATSESTTVAAAAEEMATNMQNMAGSTEQMTSNVKTVAMNIDELTCSISEIAQTADQSSTIAARAANLAQKSNTTIAELGVAAGEIGTVAKVIDSIAQQTDLLALNATIEAARAGDAGKGFAVVAREVKELAQQTAEATEDIRKRIDVIQSSAIEAVQSIKEVSEVIEEVNHTSGTIAAAVEEQNSLTKGIAQNVNETAEQTSAVSMGVQESASACGEVARSICGVDQASRETADSATKTQCIGDSLLELSNELTASVAIFTRSDSTKLAGTNG